MIAVRIEFNTDADGNPVDVTQIDWANDQEAPVCYFGPFDTMDLAVDWMHNGYPDDDTDVHEIEADEYDIPAEWLNTPESVTA